ncbi:arginase [Actinomadura cremea]|nr:arginase [Actinomadura cremea]
METVTVLKVPQWQGAATPRARLLTDGAERLARLLPGGRILSVPVPDTPGTERDGVRALDVLAAVAAASRATVARESPLVTVGGDCGVELAPVSAALARHGDALAVVWFDAHADMNTPETSPSRAFHGMVMRTLLGEGPAALLPERPLHPEQVVLAGARALDPAEQVYIDETGVRHLAPGDLDADRLIETVTATGATAVYVHIDLDVLDPAAFGSLNCPEPGGITPETLRTAVQALTSRFAFAGLGITEYVPTVPADQETLVDLLPNLLPHGG